MSEKEKNKPCITCIKVCSSLEKKQLKSLLVEGQFCFSSVNHRPNAKAHTVIMTKRHCLGMKDMTPQEWADILPILKNSISKINRVYHPLGYRINIPLGERAGQNVPYHFYMRVVPKYKKNWGSVGTVTNYKAATSEEIKKVQVLFNPKQDGHIGETNKLVAKLHNESGFGYTVITTKQHLPCEVEVIDSEIWAELYQLLQELMKKMENGLDARDFIISCNLGKEAQKVSKEEKEEFLYPDFYENLEKGADKGELAITLAPKYEMKRYWLPNEGARPVKKNQLVGSFENERIAEKLRDPEAYYKEWGKTSPSTRKNQPDSSTSPQPTETQRERERERF